MPLSPWFGRQRTRRNLLLEVLEDRTAPALAVLSASPAPPWVAVPMTTLDLTFDNPVNPATVQTSDLNLLRNGSTFGSVTAAQVVPGTNGQTVRFTLSGLTTPGPLETYVRSGSVLAANGDPNAAYQANYTLTTIGFSAVQPLGGLVYSGSRSGGTHTFAVEAGQTITLVVTAPVAGTTPLGVTLRGPAVGTNPGPVLGSAAAPRLGAAAVLQTAVAPATGVYTATISGGPVSVGPTLKVFLNAAQEMEGTGAEVNNNTPGTAQDLSGAFLPLTAGAGGPERAGVVGTFTGSADHYAISLQAGEPVSVALSQANPGNQLFLTPSVVTQSPQVGSAPTDVAVGDLNGDGLPDLVQVLSNPGGTAGDLLVKYGLGNGTFFQGDAVSAGGGTPKAVRLGDVNGDGILDAVVANEGGGSVAVLLGTGNDPFSGDGPPPAFGPAVLYEGGASPRDLALGDLNGDGWLDVAVGNGSGNNVNVLLNGGDGTFGATQTVNLGGLTYITNGVAIGDVTGDGHADIVAVTVDNPSLAVLPGNGTGAFTGPAITVSTGGASPQDLALADFNGDGWLDAAVAHASGFPVTVLLNQNVQAAPFGPWTPASAPSSPGMNRLAVADFNLDGHLDLAATPAVTSNPSARVWLGDGLGQFDNRLEYALSGPVGTPAASSPLGIAAADFNGDGTADLVTANTGSNNLSLLANAQSRLRLDVVDADGDVLVSGVTAANATSAVGGFVAPAGGTYYVRVSGAGRSDYAAVVTRGADFEVERNDNTLAADPLTSSGVLGHLSSSQRLFAAVPSVNGGPGLIQELTPAGAVVRTFAAPTTFAASEPVGLAFDGSSLFFVDWYSSHNVFELDPETGAVRDADAVPVAFNGVDGLAALGGKVYVSDGAGNALMSFDPVTDTFGPYLTVSTINPGAGDLFGGIAGITGPNRLVATANTTQGVRVVEIDPATGLITSSFAPAVSAPNGAVRGVAVVEGRIYLSRQDGPRFDVYTRSGSYVQSGSISPQVVALGGDDNSLSATDWYAIEVGFQQEIRLETFTPGDGPGEFANSLNPLIELFDPSGTLVATGTPGSDGRNETITYAGFSSGTYKVRVTAQNNTAGEYYLAAAYSAAPQAGDDFGSTDEDVPVTFDVLDDDTDLDGDTLYVAGLTQPGHGGVTLNGDGTITYTPAADYTGDDAFTYTVSDGKGGTSTATVTVYVNGVNDAPVVRDDAYVTDEDVRLEVPAPGVFGNDHDVDAGDRFTYVEYVDAPEHGEVGIYDDGRVVYIPNENYHGPDQFTYRVKDVQGVFSNLATVRITVNSVNDAPFAGDYGGSGTEDRSFSVDIQEITSDADGDARTVTELTQPAHGTAVLNDGGTVTYTPDANYFGYDEFTYTVTDGNGGFDTGTIWVDLYPVNDTPDARPDDYATDEDTPLVVAAADGVLANDTDIEGDTLTAVLVFGPYHGDLTLNDDGSFTYTPDPNYNGPDEFTYLSKDSPSSGTGPIKVTLTVNPVNGGPEAAADEYATDEDTALTVDASGVLANDTDEEGDALSVTLASGPAHGDLTLNGDGSFTYTPDADYHGMDEFTYLVSDGNGGSATGTVTLTVNPVNDSPAAADDAAAADEDTAVTVAVLANDIDVDGDGLAVTGVTQGSHGTAAANADGTVTYTPAANFHGSDSFTYTISDGHGGTATATVSVAVRPVNDAPALPDATFTVAENSANGTVVGTVTGSDTDGDALTYSITGGNAGGAFAINSSTGRITVANSAALDFETRPVFTLTVEVRDPDGLTAAATVTVNLTDVPPQAVIDIIPGSTGNQIDLKKTSTFEVAILSSSEFDARYVDLNSIRFGVTGQEDSVSRHRKRGVQYRLADVNGDGRLDLVVTVVTSKTGLGVGDTKAVLTCRLTDDPTLYAAEDTVAIRSNKR